MLPTWRRPVGEGAKRVTMVMRAPIAEAGALGERSAGPRAAPLERGLARLAVIEDAAGIGLHRGLDRIARRVMLETIALLSEQVSIPSTKSLSILIRSKGKRRR